METLSRRASEAASAALAEYLRSPFLGGVANPVDGRGPRRLRVPGGGPDYRRGGLVRGVLQRP